MKKIVLILMTLMSLVSARAHAEFPDNVNNTRGKVSFTVTASEFFAN